MSLSDIFKSSLRFTKEHDGKTSPLTSELTRSRSFGGLLMHNQHRRSTSATYTLANGGLCYSGSTGSLSTSSSTGSVARTSSNNSTLSRGGSVLGHNHSPNSTRRLLHGLSATWSGKSAPIPRPQRTVAIFQAIERGLLDCIGLTQKDIANLKSSAECLSANSLQQLKGAERYLKRLECQVAKLEEFQEQYDVQQRLHDGARTMAHAYVLGPGKDRETALQSVRSGLQECTDVLCGIELELERMMGTLMFKIKGIQGFARLCTGDVFEITVRYGDRKWKAKGRIMKNGKQVWDNPQAIFKALLGEVLLIKATEVRTLGKNILLGHKYCETKELFSASSQLMSVNLNPTGSLKLHLVVSWNPLHGGADDSINSPKPMPPLLAVLQSPISKRRSPIPPSSFDTEFSNSTQILSPMDSPSPVAPHRYTPSSPSTSVSQQQILQSHLVNEQHDLTFSSSSTTACDKWTTDDLNDENSECYSLGQGSVWFGYELSEAIHSLLSSLEDIQGQYPELHSLVLHLTHLNKILRCSKESRSRKGSIGSCISISVESALGCFDFLNTAIDSDDNESSNESPIVDEEKCLDPEMTAKTSDSGVASIARQLLDGKEAGDSVTSGIQAITGVKQLDQALSTHISYCQRLMGHLGSFGPLKCREVYSLDKLRRQASILGTFLGLLTNDEFGSKGNPVIKSVHGASLLAEGGETRRLWEVITNGGEPLCVQGEMLLEPLERIIEPLLVEWEASVTPLSVSKLLVCRIADLERFDPEVVVTVLQWQLYLSQGSASLSHNIQSLSEEASLIENLHSPDPVVVKKALMYMINIMAPAECLLTVGHLLVSGEDPNLFKAAESYLKEVLKNSNLRKQILTTFLEGMESENPLTRQGACIVFAIAKATEFTDQLVFLCYADDSGRVRQQAKETLFSFGSEGRKAFEQAQLCTHGFQGLGVY